VGKELVNKRKETTKKIVVVKKERVQKTKKNNKPKMPMTIHPSTIGRVNPFSPGVAGARAPDEFGYPTATAVLKASYAMTTNPNGYACGNWSAHPQGYQKLAFSIASPTGVVTWLGGARTNVPQIAPLRQVALLARSVAWGLRITTDLPLTAASGHLWVVHTPDDTAANGNEILPISEEQCAALPLSEKFSLVELSERPLIVPGKAFDSGSFRFRDVEDDWKDDSVYSVESSTGWSNITIYVVGAAVSVNALNVEYINHIEYIQNADTLYGFIDVAPAPPDPQAMTLNAMYEGAAPVGILETSVDTLTKVEKVLGATMRTANMGMAFMSGAARAASAMFSARGYFNGPNNTPNRLTYP